MIPGKKILCLIIVICMSLQLDGAWSWKKAVPFLTKQEETVTKNYAVDSPKLLVIEALDGTVTIRPSTRAVLTLSGLKKGIPEELPQTTLEVVESERSIVVKTKQQATTNSVTVDYTIAVPKNITKITIASRTGPVTVEDITKPLEVYTASGDITIKESTRSVQARSDKGSIYVNQKVLSPASGFIFIETMRGNVQLILPQKVCANLHARTLKGSLTCTIPVTLEPRTTVLTQQAWERMKREARGTVGVSDDFSTATPLTIDVTKGNIVISARR